MSTITTSTNSTKNPVVKKSADAFAQKGVPLETLFATNECTHHILIVLEWYAKMRMQIHVDMGTDVTPF